MRTPGWPIYHECLSWSIKAQPFSPAWWVYKGFRASYRNGWDLSRACINLTSLPIQRCFLFLFSAVLLPNKYPAAKRYLSSLLLEYPTCVQFLSKCEPQCTEGHAIITSVSKSIHRCWEYAKHRKAGLPFVGLWKWSSFVKRLEVTKSSLN